LKAERIQVHRVCLGPLSADLRFVKEGPVPNAW
jgi:hypothetical protein